MGPRGGAVEVERRGGGEGGGRGGGGRGGGREVVEVELAKDGEEGEGREGEGRGRSGGGEGIVFGGDPLFDDTKDRHLKEGGN